MGSKGDVEREELDLVEEFRALDEMGDHVDMTGRLGAFAEGEPPEGLEASIGDDLSGILALDDEDDVDDDDDEDPSDDVLGEIEKDCGDTRGLGRSPTGSTFTGPLLDRGSAARGVAKDADELDGRERDNPESHEKGPATGEVGGNDANCKETVVSSEGQENEGTWKREALGTPSPSDTTSLKRVDKDSVRSSSLQKRTGDGQSDEKSSNATQGDDAKTNDKRAPPTVHPHPSSCLQEARCPLPAVGKGCGAANGGKGDHAASREYPRPQSRASSAAGDRATTKDAEGQEYLPPRYSTDDRQCINGGDKDPVLLESKKADPLVTSPSPAGVTISEADVAAAEKIKSLQTELSLLKEHVLRCEQKREAQLRELQTRLEAQEHRNRSSILGASGTRKSTEAPEGETCASAPETPVAPEGAQTNDEEDTPRGPAVHNPFAAQGGGTDTPRDHFPAFEDALHDAGSDSAAARAVNGAGADGDDDKSRQSEAFEFSIDTLSHINNHTDFGTEIPVASAAAAGAVGTTSSRKSKREARAKRDGASRPRVVSGDFHRDAALRRQEVEEVFDAQDTAAEEAFFADACATAILQTPVKHVLAAGGSGGDGVVVRRARQSTRSAQLVSGKRNSDEEISVSGREAQKLSDGNTPGKFLQEEDDAGSRRGSEGADSQELCMADFFVRATKQLQENSTAKTGELPPPKEDDQLAPGTQGDEERPTTVDAATQTTWSFSAHHGVRFVSTPLRTPLGTLDAVKRDIDQRPERDSLWALRYPPEAASPGDRLSGPRGKMASGWGGRGAEASVATFRDLQEDEGSFRTPLASRPRTWRVSGDASRPGCSGEPRGGGSSLSDASTYFQSPGLSPIVDTRSGCPSRYQSKTEEAKDESMRGMVATNVNACKLGEGLVECSDARSGQRRRSRRGMTPGLSPITSERGEGSGRLSPARVTTAHAAPRSTCAKSRMDSTARSSVEDSFCRESSFDASGRSSLYMASTTLESMAPLDGTTQSFASHLRGNSSFAGELFADERLRECCGMRPARHSKGCHPQTRRSERGKWLLAPPPPKARTGRRPAHSGTLSPPSPLSQDAIDNVSAAEELAQSSSMRLNGVPPAVVGAWLAAAIEGFYGQHGGSGEDPQGKAGIAGPLDPNVPLGKSPLTETRRRRANPGALLKEANEFGIRDRDAQFDYVRAMGRPSHTLHPADSPPPPPPPSPPSDPNRSQDPRAEHRIGEADQEEDLFYQRQRLLHRVAAATTGHGAVTHVPFRGAARTGLPVEEPLDQWGVDWRRHSDPLAGKPPQVVSTSGVTSRISEGLAGAAGNGCASWGTPSYLRRETSEYWRERLGMSL